MRNVSIRFDQETLREARAWGEERGLRLSAAIRLLVQVGLGEDVSDAAAREGYTRGLADFQADLRAVRKRRREG